MKYLRIVLLTTLAGIIMSCGSSRRVTRPNYLPDQLHSSLDKSVGQNHESRNKSKLSGKSNPLAVRIDNLLLAEDSLLQHSQLGLHIVNLTTGQVIYAKGSCQRMRPASSEKVVTAIAALDLLGPSYQFSTQLLTTAAVSGSTLQGDLYIKGSMDPLLTAADCRSIAMQLKAAGIRTIAGRLIADASMKDSDEYGWGWCWDDENPVLSPLLCGGKPGLEGVMQSALRAAGITVKKGIAAGVAPATARELTALRRPLTAVLQPMMKESDNLCAEAVFYQIPRRGGDKPASAKHYSRRQAVEGINEVLSKSCLNGNTLQGVPYLVDHVGDEVSIADGSGLSLYNYQTPEAFTRLLGYAAARPDSILRPLLAALPIASVDGTLRKRMAGTSAAANVRAKTGSVMAVSTLVGYTTQRSTGHLIAFAIMNQGVQRMADGRSFQDKVCVLLSE